MDAMVNDLSGGSADLSAYFLEESAKYHTATDKAALAQVAATYAVAAALERLHDVKVKHTETYWRDVLR